MKRELASRERWCLLAQDNIQEGSVDMEPAIVFNEAEFLEFVHEKIDPGARCANHLGQHLLRYFGKHLLRLVLVVALPALFVLTEPNANGLREHQMEGV